MNQLLEYLKKRINFLRLWKGIEKKSAQEVFTSIYKSNIWGGKKSVSGKGSDVEQTATIVRELPSLFKQYEIKSMLDIPCGDYEWMSKVDKSGIDYIGADIVHDLIEENKAKYSSESVHFQVLNLIEDKLPTVDLMFVRDCLVHLSYENICKSIENIKASGSKYLLTTSFVNRKKNKDIVTGRWRALNLMVKPFNFSQPLEMLNENCTEGNGRYSDKTLCLWKISDL